MADTRRDDEIDWSVTTWEGNRRAQLHTWCKLSLRERLEALDAMHDLANTPSRTYRKGTTHSSASAA